MKQKVGNGNNKSQNEILTETIEMISNIRGLVLWKAINIGNEIEDITIDIIVI